MMPRITSKYFSVGLEFEFNSILTSNYSTQPYETKHIGDIDYDEFCRTFRLTQAEKDQIDCIIQIIDGRSPYNDSSWKRIGPGVCLIMLMSDGMPLRCSVKNLSLPLSTILSEFEMGMCDGKRIRRLVHSAIVNVPQHFSSKQSSQTLEKTARLLSKNLKQDVQSLEYNKKDEIYYKEKPKKIFGWYLTWEGSTTDSEDYYINTTMGMELITPPLTIAGAKQAVRQVCRLFQHTPPGLLIQTNTNCGVHVNISNQTFSPAEYSRPYIACMFNDEKWMRRFGRLDEEYRGYRCQLTYPIELIIRNGWVGLDDFRTVEGVYKIDRILHAIMEGDSYRSIEFEHMNEYNYLEHRSAGGTNWPRRPEVICAYIDDLIRFTQTLPYWLDNHAYWRKLKRKFVAAGLVQKQSVRPHSFNIVMDNLPYLL